MKQHFNFLAFSANIQGIISLPNEVKEKKNPFIVINTDNDYGLYVKQLKKELDKYKNLTGISDFHDIETNNLIVFGDNANFDYRIEMNYYTLNNLPYKRDVKIFDLVDDFDKIVRRLATYCKNNGIKRKYATTRSATRPIECPLFTTVEYETYVPIPVAKKVKKTLFSVYKKPDVSVEKITVHANWVKIGWNQYDIYVDLRGEEFIVLEDGEKLFIVTDRFGRRYLKA